MAINLSWLPVLNWLIKDNGLTGKIMTLGRQTVGFGIDELLPFCESKTQEKVLKEIDGDLTQEPLFEVLGFDTVHSLDVSDYEGCTHLFDLNATELPKQLTEQYDLVVDGGTLEHIFDFLQGLTNAINMVKPGGYFLHSGPCNNWIDHGFFQFSPTLWFDFAKANELDIVVSASIEIDRTKDLPECVIIKPLKPQEGKVLSQYRGRVAHLLLARRRKKANGPWITPKQNTYLFKHGDNNGVFEIGMFYPFSVQNGVKKCLSLKHIPIDKSEVERVKDLEGTFFIRVRDVNVKGGSNNRPFRSPFIILENGIPLPIQASSADAGFDSRPGRFCHRGKKIFFSASDGSDVLENTYYYEMLLVQ